MLEFSDPTKVFAISDLHYAHKNICRGCSSWGDGGTRDFNTLDEMNFAIVNSINQTIKEDDVLFHLGDWAFGGRENIKKLRDQIRCRTIYQILGNHDHHIEKPEFASLFTKTWGTVEEPQYVTIKVGRYKYILGHYKMAVWYKSHHEIRHLWGHSHSSYPDNPNEFSFDIGWDIWRKPLSFVEIESVFSKKQFQPVDHHKDKSQE